MVLDGSDGPNDDLFLLRCVLSSVEIAGSLGCGILSVEWLPPESELKVQWYLSCFFGEKTSLNEKYGY